MPGGKSASSVRSASPGKVRTGSVPGLAKKTVSSADGTGTAAGGTGTAGGGTGTATGVAGAGNKISLINIARLFWVILLVSVMVNKGKKGYFFISSFLAYAAFHYLSVLDENNP
jgi:hypothetical protein